MPAPRAGHGQQRSRSTAESASSQQRRNRSGQSTLRPWVKRGVVIRSVARDRRPPAGSAQPRSNGTSRDHRGRQRVPSPSIARPRHTNRNMPSSRRNRRKGKSPVVPSPVAPWRQKPAESAQRRQPPQPRPRKLPGKPFPNAPWRKEAKIKPVMKWGLKFKKGVAESARHRYQPWNMSHLQFCKPRGQKWDKRTVVTLKWLKNHRKMLKRELEQAEIKLDRIIADGILGEKRTEAEHNLMRQFYKYHKLDNLGKIILDQVDDGSGKYEQEWSMSPEQKERNKLLAAAEDKPYGPFWREALFKFAEKAESPPSWLPKEEDSAAPRSDAQASAANQNRRSTSQDASRQRGSRDVPPRAGSVHAGAPKQPTLDSAAASASDCLLYTSPSPRDS